MLRRGSCGGTLMKLQPRGWPASRSSSFALLAVTACRPRPPTTPVQPPGTFAPVAPVNQGAAAVRVQLNLVSCGTPTFCVAVPAEDTDSEFRPLRWAEAWDGTGWAPVPSPGHAVVALDCAGRWCLALSGADPYCGLRRLDLGRPGVDPRDPARRAGGAGPVVLPADALRRRGPGRRQERGPAGRRPFVDADRRDPLRHRVALRGRVPPR